MILSHEHKFIFLKPRKVAGTSFEIALSRFVNRPDDIVTPISRKDEAIRRSHGFAGPRNFQFEFLKRFSADPQRPARLFGYELPLKFYNHIPAARAKSRLPSDVWRDYQRISLVRNPWDRAVSLFFWRNKGSEKPDLKDFTTYFKNNQKYLEINYPNYRVGGEDVIDRYLRYEHFQEDMLALEAERPTLSGLWETFSGINAKGAARDRSVTTAEIFASHPEVNAMVERLNAWEIEKFGYRLQ
ncbi:MAG: hypothetical protein RLZZ444_4212 [Pseudomonadota bacterium]